MVRPSLLSARLRTALARTLRCGRAGTRPLLGLLVVWSLLASPLQVLLNARGATGGAPALAHSAFDVPANTPTPTPTATATATPTGTGTPPSLPPPPPTNTIGLPTAVPTGTPIPDTDVVDQEIAAEQAGILADVAALPVLTGTITGTLVSTLTGGQVSSADGGLTLGLLPNLLPLTSTLDVQVLTTTFPAADPRATRDGYPLAYMYSLSATDVLTGAPVTHFAKDVDLLFNIDPAVLAAAGVHGASLHIYTFDEQLGAWQEIPSYWNVATHQLIATTPHFSLYAVGDGFDVVNNYLPSINDFETNLQTGSASVQYPLNLPPGPGGFGPQLSLSYNSGSVDRVDNSQQGDSAVGWGWTLSMNYIAATQHHFVRDTPTPPPSPSPTATPDTYDPWTASIVVNGINGDLVKGTPLALSTGTPQPVWHTANESFVKVIYHPGTVDSPRTTDWWEAWDKSGTDYVFDIKVLTNDNAWGQGGLTTYRWMLRTATDTHQKVIHYQYRYEPGCCTPGTTPLPTIPPTDGPVRAVYPDQITYGDTGDGHGDKVRVLFTVTPRPTEGLNDYGPEPRPDIYQGWRVKGVTIERQQAPPTTSPEPSPTYAPLRTYEFIQD